MVKPDAVRRGLVGEIIARLERTGLELIAIRGVHATPELAGLQYGQEIADKHSEDVRRWLIEYMCQGLVIAMAWEGDNCVTAARAIAGDEPCPTECQPGTIRRDFCTDSLELASSHQRAIQNLIHTADSAESARRESKVWFDQELADM